MTRPRDRRPEGLALSPREMFWKTGNRAFLRHDECFHEITRAGDIMRVCRTCGLAFVLTAAERRWFEDRALKVPCRCGPCRRARRDDAREQE